MKRMVLCTLIMIGVILFSALPGYAQQPTQSVQTCPYQQACTIINQAIQLIGQYGIPATELDKLVLVLVKKDPQAISDQLASYGLTPEQQQQLLAQAAPLLDSVNTNQYLRQYVGQLMQNSMQDKVPADKQDDVLMNLDDKDALAALLAEAGMSEEDIAQFLLDAETYGFSPADYDTLVTLAAFGDALTAAGIAPEDQDAFFEAALTSPEALEALLTEAGIDLGSFYDTFNAAYVGYFMAAGFSEEDLVAFQDAAFLDYLTYAMLDGSDFANLLAAYGYSPEDIAYYLEKGVEALLKDYGFDEGTLNAFLDASQQLGIDPGRTLEDLGLGNISGGGGGSSDSGNDDHKGSQDQGGGGSDSDSGGGDGDGD